MMIMSKYNVGDKFILEVGESYTTEMLFGNEEGSPIRLYKAKGFKSLVFDENGLDKLEKMEEELPIPYDEAEYNRGLQDAWELAKGLYLGENQKYSDNQYEKIFGGLGLCYVINNYTPQEALAKLEAYEKERAEIKVGDVVEDRCGKKVVVTRVSEDKSIVECLGMGGYAHRYDYLSMTKTGKHIDIASLLAEIANEH